MNILVCIKQVPDMEAKFAVAANGVWYDPTDLAWRMNEYDEYGVEQAVQLKEQVAGSDVTVLCIGTGKAKEIMKKALAMGCDRGVHVADDEVFSREPYEIAAIIAEFARDKGFDLVITGMQSQDRGSAQVGLLVAEMLDLPGISTVVGCSLNGDGLALSRELEGGVRAKVRVNLPALFTCQLGLNKPRYPTLPNIMKAKKKELITIAVADLLKVAGRQATTALFVPQKKGGGLVLEGDPAELADKLIGILKEKTTVLS
jgi:electron transfer flavoprotein beta subunit